MGCCNVEVRGLKILGTNEMINEEWLENGNHLEAADGKLIYAKY
jgi:hypothetical protein